ncbi:MAG: hypothetical protein QXS76_01680 [Candidatus Bathyarchaeia archaeon]
MNHKVAKRRRRRSVLLHINVTREIADQLKDIAKRQGRTVAELAREAFARLIRDYSVPPGNDGSDCRKNT